MKKKIFIIIGAIVILAVIGSVLFFVLNGNEKQSDNTNVSLTGTWLIFQHGEDNPQNEFMVFTESNVSYYRGESDNPAATSTYSIQNDKLNTPDIDKTFNIHFISNNHVELIESNTVVWQLLLVGEPSVDKNEIIPKDIAGVYDVKVVGDEKRFNETMTFTDTHLSFVQDGKETISSDYIISDDGILHLTTINRDYYAYINDNNLLFIDVNENAVWELYKTK